MQHIIGRMGYQNKSPHYVPEYFNGLRPKLRQPSYTYVLERDDTKIGMMLIELVSPVIFGSTSTLHEDIDGPGVIGEMQRMHISPEYSSNKRGGRATVFVQMLPFIWPKELRKDETTPLLGCLKGLPAGANANSLSGACLHEVRRWHHAL